VGNCPHDSRAATLSGWAAAIQRIRRLIVSTPAASRFLCEIQLVE
jgi:hypothetical protein